MEFQLANAPKILGIGCWVGQGIGWDGVLVGMCCWVGWDVLLGGIGCLVGLVFR